jgi:hypothetical protein
MKQANCLDHIPSNAAEPFVAWSRSKQRAKDGPSFSAIYRGRKDTHINNHVRVTTCYQQWPFLWNIFAAENNDFFEETREGGFGQAPDGKVSGSERHPRRQARARGC